MDIVYLCNQPRASRTALRLACAVIGLVVFSLSLVLNEGLAAERKGAAKSPQREVTRVRYDPPATVESRDLLVELKKQRFLESFAAEVDQVLRLPKTLTLRMSECDEANAYYLAETRTILLCYGLMPAIARDLGSAVQEEEQLTEAVSHVFSFMFLHELGHALIDILDLTVSGKEEDVADQLSVYVLLQEEGGVSAALDGAAWFGVRSHMTNAAAAFWDSHSLDAQRYYNINCWVYGSNPEDLAHIPETAGLPLSRAVGCPKDYEALTRYWDKALRNVLVQPGR